MIRMKQILNESDTSSSTSKNKLVNEAKLKKMSKDQIKVIKASSEITDVILRNTGPRAYEIKKVGNRIYTDIAKLIDLLEEDI